MKFEVEIDTKEVVAEEDKDKLSIAIMKATRTFLDEKYPDMQAIISVIAKMNYIKASYKGSAKSYTFKTVDDVAVGDTVETADGKHLIVVDEPVDMEWVESYSAEKIVAVKKVEVDSDAKTESV